MENSIIYGLRNPAMTDDIGMTMIERQYPTNITPIGYVPADVTNRSIINAGPNSDIFQTKRQKEYSAFKKILVGLGALALGIFAYKKGVKGIKELFKNAKDLFTQGTKSESAKITAGGITNKCKKGYEYIKKHIKDFYTEGKNVITNLINKIKPQKVSP